MGLNSPHALGRNLRFFAKSEATYGTYIKPVSTDAVKVLSSTFSHSQGRELRIDSRQTRSHLERYSKKKEDTWSTEGYLIASGAAGTSPDINVMLKNAMGTSTNIPATSQTYGLSATQTALSSMSLCRNVGTTGLGEVVQEQLSGAWIEEFTISASGGDEPRVSFSGGAKDHVHVGTGEVTSAAAAVVTMDAGETKGFEVGGIVQILQADGTVRDDNTSAGFAITLISGNDITLDGSPAGVTATDFMAPFVPAETTVGSPGNGIDGSVTVDAVSVPITGFSVTLSNGVVAVNDEYGNDSNQDIIPGYRTVNGELSLRARKDQVHYLRARKDFAARDIQIICGSTAGGIVTINVDFAELDFSELAVPESEEATFTLPFVGLGSAGEDELEIVFT